MCPDGIWYSSMTFSFVPSCGTAPSGHVTVPHVKSMVRAFEELSGMAKSYVPELSGMELTVVRHLINSCGVPGRTGAKREPTTMNVHAIDTEGNAIVHAITMVARGSGAGVVDTAGNFADSVPEDHQQATGVWNRTAFRHVYPYALFNKSPLELRRIGALGGKAHGRNQRARRALLPAPPETTPLRTASPQTTAEAIALLDARFPWLQRAEQRRCPNTSSHCKRAHCAR
jgi:hypothetical protein